MSDSLTNNNTENTTLCQKGDTKNEETYWRKVTVLLLRAGGHYC